jgi:hypothetical protein
MKFEDRKKPTWRIPYKGMRFIYIYSYYDLPLQGLCRMGKELCKFQLIDYDAKRIKYHVFKMPWYEKIYHLWNKKLFELCIGYHWSYPELRKPPYFYHRKPKWFWTLIFNIYYGQWRKIWSNSTW